MALACHPDLIIADEPTTALDVMVQAQILKAIGELREELNLSMMLITHDLSVIAQTCDSVVIMYAGKVMEYGSVLDVYVNPTHLMLWDGEVLPEHPCRKIASEVAAGVSSEPDCSPARLQVPSAVPACG